MRPPVVVSDPAVLADRLHAWRSVGSSVGLVPTMGNLHEGHLGLVRSAAASVRHVIVSIFVNPTQFGPNEDFARYPRTLEHDLAQLTGSGCDLVWAPSVATMYPLGPGQGFGVSVPAELGNILCGDARPGHFDGVASVVLRLFNQVGPDMAFFGEKDFQQLRIIEHMANDLSLSVRIKALPTVRETDGLAMSSRNGYLDSGQRRQAPLLHRVLSQCVARLDAGQDWTAVQTEGLAELATAGFDVDYLALCDAETLAGPDPRRPMRLLVAARLGSTRLIDNLAVQPRGTVGTS